MMMIMMMITAHLQLLTLLMGQLALLQPGHQFSVSAVSPVSLPALVRAGSGHP